MASEYIRILNGEKVVCPSCNKGYFEPVIKELPIEKVNSFECTHCKEKLLITRKLKIKKGD